MGRPMPGTTSLVARNFLFTVVVPGLGAVLIPRWVLARFDRTASPTEWQAVVVITVGAEREGRSSLDRMAPHQPTHAAGGHCEKETSR